MRGEQHKLKVITKPSETLYSHDLVTRTVHVRTKLNIKVDVKKKFI